MKAEFPSYHLLEITNQPHCHCLCPSSLHNQPPLDYKGSLANRTVNMPNTINITIKNRSLAPQAFLLFQALPTPANIPSAEVFTNVYQRSPKLGGNASDQVTFQITNEFYGIYGTNTASLDQKVRISTSGSAKATLQSTPTSGAVNGSTFYLSTLDGDGVSPTFKGTDQTTTAQGAFTIQSDGTFDVTNKGKHKTFLLSSLSLVL